MARETSGKWHRYLRFWQPSVTADVDDEISFHLDARVDELVDAGLDPAAARARALHEFGDVDRAKGTLRALDERHAGERRRIALFADAWGDVRIAARSLRKAPGFVAIVSLTLALGIGLNSAVYSIVDAFLFRPLPVAHGAELVVLGQTDNALREPHELSYPDFKDYRADTTIFRDLAASVNMPASLSGSHGTARVFLEEVSANYFSVLGVTPLAGRVFVAGEDEGALAHPLLVLTYKGWQSRFGGDPRIVGDTIRLNNQIVRVIGITPQEFHGNAPLLDIDGFMPLDQISPGHANFALRDNLLLNPIGRLRAGLSLVRARQMIDATARHLEALYPSTNRNVRVVLHRETHARLLPFADRVSTVAVAFFVLVALVLLTACANIAGLLLARSSARYKELAVRVALGASTWRLMRQVFIECAMLAVLGGGGAILFANWALRALASIRVAADFPVRWDIRLDLRVVAFTGVIVAITALVATLAPAFTVRRADVHDALKSGARGSSGGQQRIRTLLVVAQLAVSVVVLVAAALFARSTANATHMDLGMRTDHLLMSSVALGEQGYDSTRGKAFYRDIVRRVSLLPGVEGAALSAYTPFGYNNDIEHIYPDVATAPVPDNGVGVFTNVVSTGYFTVMAIPILAGRPVTDRDDEHARDVAVVNAAFARSFWPGASAIGQFFRVGKDGPRIEVVGVAHDAQYFLVGEAPKPFYYRPLGQAYTPEMTLDVHTRSDPASAAPGIRAAIASIDPHLPVFDVRTMNEHLRNGRALLFTRIGAGFAVVFGMLALILASVGVYGVVSYSVVQRTREIGIRVALGARAGGVIRLVLGQGLTIALIGVAIGAGAAFFVTSLLGTLLYGVAAHDPVVFGGVSLGLALVATVASVIPAGRATRVDPLTALRAE